MGHKTFYNALILSLLVHLAVISPFSARHVKRLKKPLKNIEVTYHTVKSNTAPSPEETFKKIKVIQKKETEKKVRIHSKQSELAPAFKTSVKDMTKLTEKISLNNKLRPRLSTLDMEKKITIPLFKSEKITNPKYLSYNDNIRRKIRERAYTFVDDPEFDSGRVYLSFVLMNDGKLREIKIREDKSNANEFLKTVGLRSIQESNPFPPFPEDLTYPELPFNIVISFEVKE